MKSDNLARSLAMMEDELKRAEERVKIAEERVSIKFKFCFKFLKNIGQDCCEAGNLKLKWVDGTDKENPTQYILCACFSVFVPHG